MLEQTTTTVIEESQTEYVVRKDTFNGFDLSSSVPVFYTNDIIEAVKCARKLADKYGTLNSSYFVHADNNRYIVGDHIITFAHRVSKLYERDMYVVPGIDYAEVVFLEEVNNRTVIYTVKYQEEK